MRQARPVAPEAAGRTYNLSGDEVVTILEIAERVQENTDNCEIVHTPPRPGDFPGKERDDAAELGRPCHLQEHLQGLIHGRVNRGLICRARHVSIQRDDNDARGAVDGCACDLPARR